jgi:hypothetical protein
MMRQADLIIVMLQGELLSELRHQLDDLGPAVALDACHLAAITVARRTMRDEGVAVGRTSARLRNPSNASPAWAAALIEPYANSPRARVDGFVVDLGDRVACCGRFANNGSARPAMGPRRRCAPTSARAWRNAIPQTAPWGSTTAISADGSGSKVPRHGRP